MPVGLLQAQLLLPRSFTNAITPTRISSAHSICVCWSDYGEAREVIRTLTSMSTLATLVVPSAVTTESIVVDDSGSCQMPDLSTNLLRGASHASPRLFRSRSSNIASTRTVVRLMISECALYHIARPFCPGASSYSVNSHCVSHD